MAAVLETTTDINLATDLLYTVLRRKTLHRPADIEFCIKDFATQILGYADLAAKADFEYTQRHNISETTDLLSQIFASFSNFRNDLSAIQNVIDLCKRNIVGTTLKPQEIATYFDSTVSKTAITLSLQQLAGDFEGWRMERTCDGWYLVVRTKPISLHCSDYNLTIPFGNFQIRLSLQELLRGVSQPYTLIAENYTIIPSGYESTPHPHVKGTRLCEGAGETAIHRALAKGDIFTFFITIDQILNTYNAGSPYCKLSVYAAEYARRNPSVQRVAVEPARAVRQLCHGCGTAITSTNTITCEECDYQFCPDCTAYCDVNGISLCHDCMQGSECGACESRGEDGCPVGPRVICSSCGIAIIQDSAFICDNTRGVPARIYCEGCLITRIRDRRPCCQQPTDHCAFTSLAHSVSPAYGQQLLGEIINSQPRAENVPTLEQPEEFPHAEQVAGFSDDNTVRSNNPDQPVIVDSEITGFLTPTTPGRTGMTGITGGVISTPGIATIIQDANANVWDVPVDINIQNSQMIDTALRFEEIDADDDDEEENDDPFYVDPPAEQPQAVSTAGFLPPDTAGE